MVTEAPGARTVKDESEFLAATCSGMYLTLMPLKAGTAPDALEMPKLFVAYGDNSDVGSLRIFRVSSPVLVRVADTPRFATSTTESTPVQND